MASAATRGRPAIVAKTELGLGAAKVAAIRLVNEGKTVQIEFPTGWDVLQVARSTVKTGTSTKIKFVAQSLDLDTGKDKTVLDLGEGKSLTAALVGDGQSVLVTLPDGWDFDSFTRSPIVDGGRTKATFTTATQVTAVSKAPAPVAAPVVEKAQAPAPAPAKKAAARKAPAAKPAAKKAATPAVKKEAAKPRATRARATKKTASSAA